MTWADYLSDSFDEMGRKYEYVYFMCCASNLLSVRTKLSTFSCIHMHQYIVIHSKFSHLLVER